MNLGVEDGSQVLMPRLEELLWKVCLSIRHTFTG